MRRPPMAAAWECWPRLPRIAAVDDVTMSVPRASLLHQRADGSRHPKQAEGSQPPAQLEDLVAGLRERPVADLRAQVVDRRLDRADVGLDRGDSLLYGVGCHGVQQETGRGTAVRDDPCDRAVQALFVRPPAEHRVVPLASEAACDVAPDAGTGTDNETHRLH